jgi:hypothetical protein
VTEHLMNRIESIPDARTRLLRRLTSMETGARKSVKYWMKERDRLRALDPPPDWQSSYLRSASTKITRFTKHADNLAAEIEVVRNG